MRLPDRPIDSHSETQVIRIDDQLPHAESVAAALQRDAGFEGRRLTGLKASSILN